MPPSATRGEGRAIDASTKKNKTPESFHSPVSKSSAGFTTGISWFGVVVGRLNSECPQQNRADEDEHGAHGKHIPFQGKVHGSLPC
jgi:hypothetical protein